jgi:chromatin segregation and condensation protein Rec8/ScpA/Scc1 (kleisin family)
VTMFMALLELIKLNRLHVRQESAYEDIVLSA